jgi:hypothetical protein
VYSLKHFPGLVRPARPALYLAEAFDIGETSNDSTLNLGLNTFCFAKPGSITYVIPSIVNDVSAIRVVRIILILPGCSLKTSYCSSLDNNPCRGNILIYFKF